MIFNQIIYHYFKSESLTECGIKNVLQFENLSQVSICKCLEISRETMG